MSNSSEKWEQLKSFFKMEGENFGLEEWVRKFNDSIKVNVSHVLVGENAISAEFGDRICYQTQMIWQQNSWKPVCSCRAAYPCRHVTAIAMLGYSLYQIGQAEFGNNSAPMQAKVSSEFIPLGQINPITPQAWNSYPKAVTLADVFALTYLSIVCQQLMVRGQKYLPTIIRKLGPSYYWLGSNEENLFFDKMPENFEADNKSSTNYDKRAV